MCLFIDAKISSYTICGVRGSSDSQGLGAKTGIRCVTPSWWSKAETAPATVSGEHRSDLGHWSRKLREGRNRCCDPQVRRPALSANVHGRGVRRKVYDANDLRAPFSAPSRTSFGVKSCQCICLSCCARRRRERFYAARAAHAHLNDRSIAARLRLQSAMLSRVRNRLRERKL